MVRCELEKARELRWLKYLSFPAKASLLKTADNTCVNSYVLSEGALVELELY